VWSGLEAGCLPTKTETERRGRTLPDKTVTRYKSDEAEELKGRTGVVEILVA